MVLDGSNPHVGNVPDGMTIQQGVNSGVSERMKQVTFSAGGDSERPWTHDSACSLGTAPKSVTKKTPT